MIHGRIETYRTECGNRLHVGTCTVRAESVTAGEVMCQQVPPVPGPGYERVTLEWVDEQHDGQSSCRFRILDRRKADG